MGKTRWTFVLILIAGGGLLLPAASAFSQTCNYPNWTQNAAYATGAIVRYAPNGLYYRAVHANPVPPDTLAYDPTISTYYWAQYACTPSATATATPRPRATATATTAACNYPNWTQNASYAVGAIVRYAPNGLYYRALHANPVPPDTLAYDPTVSTYYWALYSCSGGATATPTTAPRATATATSPSTSDGRNWKGRTWNISNGAMAGVVPASPSNVFVDANGFLHLRIVGSGGSYTGAETFTTGLLGFGTYQWQIQGPIDNMDKSTVLGLFPYGPAAGIGVGGENEIDIEFSKWNNSCGCNADFAFWPNTGNGSLGNASDLFTINLAGGNLVTARFVWRSNSIVGTIMSGLQPIGTTANVLRTFTFTPSNYTQRIPQQALPLGMNLWSFEVPPSSNQEVIIRDFQYVP
jgi:hypothetical protein